MHITNKNIDISLLSTTYFLEGAVPFRWLLERPRYDLPVSGLDL